MTQGSFRSGHPRVTLRLEGIHSLIDIEFIVDTGFNGEIALPPSVAQELHFTTASIREHMLASGRIERFEVCQTTVEWDGENRAVEMLIINGDPLIGTELLAELMLHVEIIEGGEVVIEPL